MFSECYEFIGGQDELVFDGQSLLLGPGGEVLARAKRFEEELLFVEVPGDAAAAGPARRPPPRP